MRKAHGRLTQRRAAFILGVTLQHLSAVIKGKRESGSLLRRYQDLLARFDSASLTSGEIESLERYKLLCKAAKVLSVPESVLVAVLSGDRDDRRLLKRYRHLADCLVNPALLLNLISLRAIRRVRTKTTPPPEPAALTTYEQTNAESPPT